MSKIYSKNKKAYHDFEILDSFEAGIKLNGDEVKSIKLGQANLKGSFIDVTETKKGLEAFIRGAHTSRYRHSSRQNYEPARTRKVLLHKKEIEKIATEIHQKGITAIPLELYAKKGLIKLKIGICRGKKLHDKRETLKHKSQQRDIERQLKRFK